MRMCMVLGRPVPQRIDSFALRTTVVLVIIAGIFFAAHAVKAPCPRPPMGWNSYDCFAYGVNEREFMQNAHYMADNLKKYGWEYVVVDFIWWVPKLGAAMGINQDGNWNLGNLDQYGRFWPDTTRFPSAKGGRGFKPLSDSVHNLGLKFGIHLMRGVPKMAVQRNCQIYNSTYTCAQAADQSSTCPWLDWMYGAKNNAAGQEYYNSMVNLCSDWGADFLKLDDLSAAIYHADEVVMYAKAIEGASRELVYSTSPGPTPVADAGHVMQYANMWRLVNDLWDTWAQLTDAYRVAEDWRNTLINGKIIAGPGHWPDVDMLPFGHLALYGPVGQPRYSLSTYTKGEHRLMFLLWCINNGPLIWGGNMVDNDKDPLDNPQAPFYDSLMRNSDAIFINQYGINGRVVKSYSTNTPIWTSTHPTDTTTKFLLFGNISDVSQTMSISLASIGFPATQSVPIRSVWTGAKTGDFTGTFTQTIPRHDASLYVLGNGSLIGVRPGLPVKMRASASMEHTCLATGGYYAIPPAYAGKTVRVSVFSLRGQLLNTVVTRTRLIQLNKPGVPPGENVVILKIVDIR